MIVSISRRFGPLWEDADTSERYSAKCCIDAGINKIKLTFMRNFIYNTTEEFAKAKQQQLGEAVLGLLTNGKSISLYKKSEGKNQGDGSYDFNGHTYVDLGLDSGRLWATYNVGVNENILTSKTDWYGNYFMWGSTTSNDEISCDWPNQPFNGGSSEYNREYQNAHKYDYMVDGCNIKITGYDQEFSYVERKELDGITYDFYAADENYFISFVCSRDFKIGDSVELLCAKNGIMTHKDPIETQVITDIITVNGGGQFLKAEYDAAHINMGGDWQMPTYDDMEELKALQHSQVSDYNGIVGLKGELFTGKNGNTLFLPNGGYRKNSNFELRDQAGWYWSCQTFPKNFNYAYQIVSSKQSFSITYDNSYCGCNVRGVI